jgi:hypothetical protein
MVAKTCDPILSAGKSTFTTAVFLEVENDTFWFTRTALPWLILRLAVMFLSPEYCKKSSTGNLFL